MRERRALRFLVEALFLGALAVALALADVEAIVIAGGMAAGWLVVALYEWAATRELPHYGRGLPPRYYVPEISLPPPRQLEQLRSGYPRAERDEPATWIATPAMRAEALADWPAAGTLPPPSPGEDTMVVDDVLLVGAAGEPFHEDTWIELHPSAEGKGDDDAQVVAVAEPEVEEPEAEVEPEPGPEVAEPALSVEASEAPVVEAVVAAAVLDAVVEEPEVAEDAKRRRPWGRGKTRKAEAVVAAALIADHAEPEAEPEPEVVAAVVEAPELVAEPEPEPEVEPEPEPELIAAPVVDEPEIWEEPEFEEEEEDTEEDVKEDVGEPIAVEAAVPAPERLARHTFDPLGGDSESRRRWRRRDDPWVELPDRPPRSTVLPGDSKRKR